MTEPTVNDTTENLTNVQQDNLLNNNNLYNQGDNSKPIFPQDIIPPSN